MQKKIMLINNESKPKNKMSMNLQSQKKRLQDTEKIKEKR